MKLHQTTGLPDWATVNPTKRTRWQWIAARTNGFVTPANFVSLLGLALVIYGLFLITGQHFIAGLVFVCVGRLCDVIDGAIADRTGTKSPLGESVDASFDKIGALLTLIVFGAQENAPWWVIILIAVQNIVNVGLSVIGKHRKVAVHPSHTGKLSTAFEWAGFFCFLLAVAASSLWLWPAYILLAIALVLGVYATTNYVRIVLTREAAAAISASKERRT